MKTKTIEALEHALTRLNNLPHKYNDTDFKLIESTLKEWYKRSRTPIKKRLAYLR